MNLPADISDFLRQVPPFDTLSEQGVEEAAGQLELSYHNRGDELGEFGPGRGNSLYLLRRGAVSLLDAQGQVLEQRGEGELFGHAVHFDGQPQPYRVRCTEDSLIWRLDTRALARLAEQSPAFAAFLQASPGERLAGAPLLAGQAVRLADLSLRAPVTAGADECIVDCAQRMRSHQVSSLPIVSEDQLPRLIGMVTDRDLRNRVLAEGLSPQEPVEQVMTTALVTARAEDTVEQALLAMLSRGIHHLPVVDAEQGLRAVISAGDLLRQHSPHPLRLVRDLARADSPHAVVNLAAQSRPMLARLAGELRDVSQVGRVAGLVTDACTRRLLELAEQELGKPPMAYAWLAFGSQARLEQGLISDQDNGLLLAEKPDADAAQWFKTLADRVCDGLAECGYSYCKGGVMAKGEWRMSLADWQATFDGWMREPEPKSVLHCSIFFDMRGVYGDLDLVERLQQPVLKKARENRIFLRFLAVEALAHRPPIGLFRRFVQERGGESGQQGLNLKKRGVLPVVDLARVAALETGLSVVHTEERLLAAAEAGLFNRQDAENLVQALRFIMRLRLEHQVRQVQRGETPDHWLDPDRLTALHRRYLRSAFDVVSTAQRAAGQRFML